MMDLGFITVPDDKTGEKIGEAYWLSQGAYLVIFNETVKVPEYCAGIARPRSTLLRCGMTMETALFDPGYVGKPQCMLVMYNPCGGWVYKNARVMQLTFIRLDEEPDKLYNGKYQGENIKFGGVR
jgi:dUTP pyrophosphatase